MDRGDNDSLSINVDECDLYRPQGFTTVALAHNDEIGRLCAIRKLDQSAKGKRVSFIEFYNTINTPHISLEWKYLSQKIGFDAVTWFGNYVVVGCSNGSLLMMSPFKNDPKSFLICASPIIAVVTLSASQIAVASESSEVKLLEFDASGDFSTKKTIKFDSEQRVVSLAASLKLSCLAVGFIDSITLIQVPSGQQSVIRVSQNVDKATVIWSLLFVDDVLFSGDSRGKVMVHNPKTGALIKMINTHRADILSIVHRASGQVFVAGTDYRIQVLGQLSSGKMKSEWATINQEIFHENDVRCMAAAGNWLVSGGADHRILVSKGVTHVNNIITPPQCSITDDGKLIAIPELKVIKIWKRPSDDAEVQTCNDVSVFTEKSGPKLLIKFSLSRHAICLQTFLTPDGRYLVSLTNEGITIYSLEWREDQKLHVSSTRCIPAYDKDPITAMYATKSALYFAHGSTTLERIDLETLDRRVVAVREADTMLIKIVVDEAEENCLVMTARSELLYIDLKVTGMDEEERFEKLEFSKVPFDFKLHVTKEGDPMAVFVISGEECKLMFLNLKTKGEEKPEINLKRFISRKMVSCVSKIMSNSIVLQKTRGKLCVIRELNEVQSFGFFLPKAAKNSSFGPSVPYETHLAVDESGKLSVVQMSSHSFEPPTSTPFNIRRFGRQ
ncbi:Cirhin [Aphelenchoides bicaudatus]|nr:Cirhin [Aphelenchoides bicaudatus]